MKIKNLLIRLLLITFGVFLSGFFFFSLANHLKIFANTSTTATGWTIYDPAVLVPGATGSWDDGRVSGPSVINDGSTYKMWYIGQDSTDAIAKIGYATSTDGINWTKYPTPVLDLSSLNEHAALPSVIKENGTYKMWLSVGLISQGVWEIEYTTSTDGINWAAPLTVLTGTLSWEVGGVTMGEVISLNGQYYMYYASPSGGSTGLATSTDGINWTKNPNPVLTPTSDELPGVSATSITVNNGVYTMFYDAKWPDTEIREATSPDGVIWTRVANNPQITAVDVPNADRVISPRTLVENGMTKMWFQDDVTGTSNTVIRYATFGSEVLPTPTPTPTPTCTSPGVLQPINTDGSSIFKLNSTVPVKLQLTGSCSSQTDATITLYVAKVTDDAVGTVVEADSTSQADTGNVFRYDATNNQYVFNMGTKDLTTGTYQLSMYYGGTNTTGSLLGTVNISLK